MQNQEPEITDIIGAEARRRLPMTPFVAQAPPFPPPQHLPLNYPQYSMPMEPSIWNYTHQQMSASVSVGICQQMPLESFCQTPMVMDSLNYEKQGHHGNLDLGKIIDILDTRSSRSDNEGAGAPAEVSSNMDINTFDINSFHVTDLARDSGEETGDLYPSGVTSSESTSSMTAVKPTAVVDAAYIEFSEPKNPKLKAEAIAKNRKEKCKFPDCPNRARVSQYYGTFCNRHVIVAPCGFPGCRDKAMERAAMCVKHLKLGKEALHKILSARTQNVPVCRTSGCFKNDQGRGYCRGHEKLMMATGHLPAHINKRRLNSAYTMCSYPECTKHSQRHHLCRTHGNLLIMQAQELANQPGVTESYEEILAKMQKDIRRCTHADCTKNSQRDRLCTTHYYERHNLQKDDSKLKSSRTGLKSARKATTGLSQQRNTGGSNVRAAERTQCDKSGGGNYSYGAGISAEHQKGTQNVIPSQACYYAARNLTSGANQALCHQSQATGGVLMNALGTKCTSPMCDRESYGQDYCDACQKLFSPIVVSMHEKSTGSSEYPMKVASEGVTQCKDKTLFCRVANCGQASVLGGLCASHFREFETGLLSVDHVKLNSWTQQCDWELAEAAAVAAAAPEELKPSSVSISGEGRRYSDKQIHKQNLSKRYYRVCEGISTEKSQPESEPSNSMAVSQPSGVSPPTVACRFPGCLEVASADIALCLMHSKAAFHWQPGCENLVE